MNKIMEHQINKVCNIEGFAYSIWYKMVQCNKIALNLRLSLLYHHEYCEHKIPQSLPILPAAS